MQHVALPENGPEGLVMLSINKFKEKFYRRDNFPGQVLVPIYKNKEKQVYLQSDYPFISLQPSMYKGKVSTESIYWL